MRIFLNDFELNNPANRVYVNEELLGLSLPDIRTSKGVRAGQSGSYFGKQLWDSRQISIQGSIFSQSVSEALQKRREIQAALPLFPERITMRIIDDDGHAYLSYCQLVKFDMPIRRRRMKSLFKIELEAGDATLYDDTNGTALSATITKPISGGMQFTTTSPQFGSTFYFSAGQPLTSVTNTSPVTVYPVIVIVGKTNDPVLTNKTTGHVWALNGYAVASDAVTQIDMYERTVRLGNVTDLVDGVLPDGVGGSVFSYVSDADDDWWGLAPGINEIELLSSQDNDVSTAELKWRPGVMGI